MRRQVGRAPAGARRSVVVVLASTVLAALAACGVGADDVRPVDDLRTAPTAGAPAATGAGSPVVYLARGEELVRSRRTLPTTPGVAEVLAALSTPVTTREALRGLRSVAGAADPEAPLFLAADDERPATPPSGPARVVATEELRALPPAQQQLAIGQVVLSLGSLGYDSVAFVDEDGTALAVPAPGGRTLDRPVTADDYAGLRAG